MDLNRWGLQKFTRITDRYRNFQEFLGQVLEGERSLIDEEKSNLAELPFSVRDDIERLLETPVPSRGIQARRIETLFEGLSSYFEAGFLLRGGPETGTRLMEMFLFGRVFVPPEAEGAAVAIALPDMRREQVLKGKVRPVLRAFRLDGIRVLGDANVFLFMPSQGVYFLLVCNRPHPWQVGMIERTHSTLQRLLAKATVHAVAKKGLFR